MIEMNSPINEMKINVEMDHHKQSTTLNELETIKSKVQEVNNNSSALNNNNPTIPNLSAPPNVQLNNAINNQQSSTIKSENQMVISSPSSSSVHQSNNSSTNSQTSICSNNSNQQSNSNYTFEYWSQLMKDSKQLQTFSNLFMHVERLLDEEISRVRKALFQNNKFENSPLVLPEPEGTIVSKQEKIYVPINEHPNYNFVGRILGPRGMTAKQLEQETGCKIMIRGKGSMRNKHMELSMVGKTNWEHLNENLHVLIIVEDTENRAKLKIERAVEEIKKLLVPVTEGEDELKKKQLMELAIINGTYKDSSTRLLESEQLKLLPQASSHHTALAVSQQHLTNLNHLPLTPQLHTHPALRQATALNNSHASNQSAIIAATSHHTATHNPATSIGPATPLMAGLMTATRPTANTHPLLLGNGGSPGATQALLNQSHINESNQQALAAYLYPPHYDLSYAAQLTSGFIEYPTMQTAMAVAAQEASTGKYGNGYSQPVYSTQYQTAVDGARRNGEQCSPKSSPRAARSPLVQGANRQDTTGTLKTTISLGKTPSILNSGPFYLMKEPSVESELTGAANLIQHYNLEHTYNKFCCGKRMKDQLSAFLPNLPGVTDIDTPGNVDNSSLRSLIEKPPIIGKELIPLSQNQLSGFRLHPGPIPERYRLMAQPSLKKHKQKKSKHRASEVSNFESQIESSNGDLASGAHEKKHKKQRKHDDEKERKKKKKDKKKKKQKQVEHSSLTNLTNPLLLGNNL